MATTMKLIAKQTLGSAAASVSFSSIPGTGFSDLFLVASLRNSAANSSVAVRFNSDTGANYTWRVLFGNGSSTGSYSQTIAAGYNTYAYGGDISYSTSTASTFGYASLYIPNYAGSTNKSASVDFAGETNAASGVALGAAAVLWSNTAAITTITLQPDPGQGGGDFAANSSVYLYGITKA
jgi:hypothetical protein